MDIGEVGNEGNQDNWWGTQPEDQEQWDINALGKDKAAGKGYKGKGKGSGQEGGTQFWGNCYSCGQPGHSAKFCPKGKGKGKGKSPLIC